MQWKIHDDQIRESDAMCELRGFDPIKSSDCIAPLNREKPISSSTDVLNLEFIVH